MLNQWLYHTIQYFKPNTKSKGGNHHHPLVADVTIISLVAWRLILSVFMNLCFLYKSSRITVS